MTNHNKIQVPIFLKLFNEKYDNFGDWNMLSWERMLRHQWNGRIWDPPDLIGSLFVILICIDKNTQVYNYTNSHFWPTLFQFLTNTLSLTLLICCPLSLSLSLSSDSPLCFHLCQFRWILLWFYEMVPLNKLDGTNTVVWLRGLLTIKIKFQHRQPLLFCIVIKLTKTNTLKWLLGIWIS